MPDYTINPNKKVFCAIGTVRGIPAVQTTSKGSEFVKFNLSVDSNMPLFNVAIFDDEGVKEAKTFTDKDKVLVGGSVEAKQVGDKTYYNVTANGCVMMSKLYGMSVASAPAAEAPASDAFENITDAGLPF